jgi:hypothetical protein
LSSRKTRVAKNRKDPKKSSTKSTKSNIESISRKRKRRRKQPCSGSELLFNNSSYCPLKKSKCSTPSDSGIDVCKSDADLDLKQQQQQPIAGCSHSYKNASAEKQDRQTFHPKNDHPKNNFKIDSDSESGDD